jgi:glycine/D-amino acid oxidase-like deaminating enzyme
MEATRNYLNQIQGSAHLGGVLRVAVNEQQRRDWPLAAGPLAQWRESGLFIPSGVTVYMRRYLEGLLALSGAELRKGELEGEFDAVIFATGIGMIEKGFPIQPVRGRAVFAEWKGDLPFALVSNGHVTPTEWEGVIGIGSTYHEESLDSLFNRVSLFFPEVREAKIVEVKEAFRAAQMGQYRPIVKRLGPKEWGFGALGSRGLLYHALLGKELADEVLSSIR